MDELFGCLLRLADRDADVRVDVDGDAADDERGLEPRVDRRCLFERSLDPVAARAQDRKLVGTEAGDERVLAERPAQARANVTQQLAARAVAERVVDLGEAVEVDQQHGDVAGMPDGFARAACDALVKKRAVG